MHNTKREGKRIAGMGKRKKKKTRIQTMYIKEEKEEAKSSFLFF